METVQKSELLSTLPFWESMSQAQKEYVGRNFALRHFEKGSIVSGGGSSCLGMVLVLSGKIRALILSEEGREITLFRLGKGDPCVFSASCVISQLTFETQIVAEKNCELLIVNSGAYEKLCEDNIFVRCFTYELMIERFSSVMFTMQSVLFNKLDRRLKDFLCDECERTGKTEIRMTHEQIAGHIGSAREVVARMLKRFSADGLVELKRGTVIVTDMEKLKRI